MIMVVALGDLVAVGVDDWGTMLTWDEAADLHRRLGLELMVRDHDMDEAEVTYE
jgi:hypothetical protein